MGGAVVPGGAGIVALRRAMIGAGGNTAALAAAGVTAP